MNNDKIAILTTSIKNANAAVDLLEEYGFYGVRIYKDVAAIVVGYDKDEKRLRSIDKTGCGVRLEDYDIILDMHLTKEIVSKFKGAKLPSVEIDAKWLIEKEACEEGFKWFVCKYGKQKVNSDVLIRVLKDTGHCDWVSWIENRIG